MIGFKYFLFDGEAHLAITARGPGAGQIIISTDEAGQEIVGQVKIVPSDEWQHFETIISLAGQHPLYLHYHGIKYTELLEIRFK